MTAWVKAKFEVWSNHTNGSVPATDPTVVATYDDNETAQKHVFHINNNRPGEFSPDSE